MSKHRKTREQKIKSAQRKTIVKKIPAKKIENIEEDILIVPVKFIKKDLTKTLIISIIFILIILGLNFYLK